MRRCAARIARGLRGLRAGNVSTALVERESAQEGRERQEKRVVKPDGAADHQRIHKRK
jgi:hypothetical protein